MSEELLEQEQRHETLVVVKRDRSAGVALGIIAIGIALASAYYAKQATDTARESTRIQQVSIRPLVKLHVFFAEFDRQSIKVSMLLSNIGRTTAVLTNVSMPLSESHDDDHIITKSGLISPDGFRAETIVIPRMHNGVDVLSYLQEKGLTIGLGYFSQEYPKEVFVDGVVFTNLKWHDKSIIGISRN